MVAAMSDSTQHPHASSSTSAPPSAEEEALKRNTDCVYFLASPLTCKKGAECEYRHSEYARVNPRDCWYWLNGSCLNPKCAFRHPPLDGLLGTPATAAPVAAPLPPQIAVPMLPPPVPAYNTTKQAVPCIFFQQGYCMKGDKCAFSHGTNPISSKAQQAPSPMPAAGQSSSKKPFGSLERCSQDQRSAPNLSKPNFVQSAPKIVPDPEKKLPVNFARVEKRAPVTRTVDEEALRYNGNLQTRPTRMNHHAHAPVDRSFQHDKESDEFLRESSPGFDVLVDDKVGEADYYHGEDHQFGNTRTTREKQFDTDFNSFSEIDQRDHPGGYDRAIGWDQRRNPSDQRTGYREGRGYRKSESPDRVNESDLRHRLSKQRRVNGLRSVVGNDSDERRVRHSSSRHEVSSRHEGSTRHEVSSSIGGRLKGRIKFPGRSDFDGEREMERGRDRSSRSYADRPRVDYGRLRGGRTSEDRREASGPSPSVRRELLDGKNEDFAGQKSLSGLKSSRIGSMSFADQQGDADASFEGPKPLSELLKRKRVDDDYDDSSSSLRGKEVVAAKAEVRSSSPPSNEEEEKAEDHPLKQTENAEEDVIVDEDAEHELEEGDEGEYEYVQVDEEGEYANYEEGGNAEEEEYIEEEEDDDDDFAKKVSVMFT